MDKEDENVIPLFPLNVVLFPQGRMKLRIFEQRYLNMVSRCMSEGTGFGVIAISEGKEVGQSLLKFIPQVLSLKL